MRAPTKTQEQIEKDNFFQEVKKILGLNEPLTWTSKHHTAYQRIDTTGATAEKVAEKVIEIMGR